MGLWSTNSAFWFSDIFLLCCLERVCLPWPPPPPPCLWSIFHELCAEGDSCPKHEHSCLLLRPVCTSQKGVFSVSINLAELPFIYGNVCSEDGRLFRESNQGTWPFFPPYYHRFMQHDFESLYHRFLHLIHLGWKEAARRGADEVQCPRDTRDCPQSKMFPSALSPFKIMLNFKYWATGSASGSGDALQAVPWI